LKGTGVHFGIAFQVAYLEMINEVIVCKNQQLFSPQPESPQPGWPLQRNRELPMETWKPFRCTAPRSSPLGSESVDKIKHRQRFRHK
uniref:Uncharacterized protein n=1 Tax=Monopterus albus TaxID=43700 RepID=A0A3Q3KCL6_MONAL